MWQRALLGGLFLIVAAVAAWLALVHTVHLGTLSVPDLVGKSPDEARQIVHDRGLVLDIAEPGVFSSVVAAGAVARQEPPAGFHVKSGAHIEARVSLGSERVEIPDLGTESVSGAVAVLQQLGLKVGRRAVVKGEAADESVLATSPAIGAAVAPGTDVDLLANATPRRPLWVAPSFLNKQLPVVQTFCRRHGFRLGQVHQTSYPGVRPATVLRQYPPAGSPLSRSDIIAVWVSR